MNEKDFPLPDELVEYIRQFSWTEDRAKFDTSEAIVNVLDEYAAVVANHLSCDIDAANKKLIEKIAAAVGMHHSSIYNRARIGRNVVARNYHVEHDVLSFGAWLELLRNAPEKDGIVEAEVLDKRLEWVYNELDDKGSLPGTRTIRNHFRQNGAHPEWEEYWGAIVRNAKKLQESEFPYPELKKVTETILWLEHDLAQRRNDG